MKLWIARDKTGELYLYKQKPALIDGTFFYDTGLWEIDEENFPEVTLENSPQEVELKFQEVELKLVEK